MNASLLKRASILAALAAATLAGAAGCKTEAYCFDECDGETSTSSGPGAGGNGGEGGCLFNCGSGGSGQGGSTGDGGSGPCMPTNNGVELCDHIDNDCNGAVDDIPGLDYEALVTCGTCDNNCYQVLLNNDPATLACVPSSNPGAEPGTCQGSCADDYYDVDGNGSCEYYCIGGTAPESICNAIDDDCDGQTDEEVNVCTSTENCGACGRTCVALHGTAGCANNGQMPCTLANTQCTITACECPDAQGNCWWDLDDNYVTGCEYQCQLTNGGVEVCGDAVDNDCDGLIDGADDLSGDPAIGNPCYGDPNGVCATPAHQGLTACVNGQVTCAGPDVLVENQQPEMCNGIDDDCNGAVDDSPSDAGGSCGQSNIFPCSFGTYQCQGGALVCNGAVNPGTETCNGVDDNCDGQIDSTAGAPPADATGPCNVRPPPPPGATSPCQGGMKACVGGTVVCQGSVGPLGPSDTCGVDANCDGVLTNQPNLMSDVANCGACGNNCYAGSVHATFSCVNGMCQSQGCQAGYYDLDGNGTCEYACVFIQAQETCNGADDNCNGQVDESVVAPSPVQVCGVSPTATSPECTGATVTCQAGTWQCSFPGGVCGNGGCASTPEVCDNLDNNCNGLLNENVPSYGKPCSSDDGLPPPGHGACRTSGTYVCNGANAVSCSAMPANCATLPGGCTEQCDGIDNDCDGSIDETFNAKGANAANFVKPVATRIAASTWIYAFEASRANADVEDPGSGNGYWTSAPAGTTIDKTPACSAPGRIPWFNVTPTEAEQTCQAMGGSLCSIENWQAACQATSTCTYGYAPRNNNGGGTACTTVATASKFCNLGLTFDFNTNVAGDQDGLLATPDPQLAPSPLMNCFADWSNLQGNTALNNKIYDITGNLREITRKPTANQYGVMGGAFNTQSQSGAACNFTFYTVNQTFKFYDAGFRCCFSADPTL